MWDWRNEVMRGMRGKEWKVQGWVAYGNEGCIYVAKIADAQHRSARFHRTYTSTAAWSLYSSSTKSDDRISRTNVRRFRICNAYFREPDLEILERVPISQIISALCHL